MTAKIMTLVVLAAFFALISAFHANRRAFAWDIYESALLLDACLRVERGEIPKETAIKELSKTLRRKAGRNDAKNTYRNEAGIAWQYNYMNCLITRPDYKRGSKVFQEIARLYREAPEKCAKILRKAEIIFSAE